MNEKKKFFDILLIEDNDDDIVILKRVFKKAQIANKLHIARNGEDALDFLYHQGKYSEEKSSAPGLILLDINMPGMNGFDIIKKLKTDFKYRKVPIIMLTTSNREEDIAKSYESGACSYITKPADFNSFVKIIEQFKIYWTFVSKIPE